jgi:uroporphyrinogen-III synthase
LSYPCIAIEPPDEDQTRALDDALRRTAMGGFDWLVLTSANTVRVLADRLTALKLTSRDLSSLGVVAVGAATRQAVEKLLGLKVALTAQEQQAEGVALVLLTAWQGNGGGQRVLLPQANLARPVLAQCLADAGAQVHTLVAYRTTLGRGGVHLAELLAAGQVDAITFTSSSTAVNCCERLRSEGGDPRCLAATPAACIGPVTAQTATSLGFSQIIMSQTPSLDGLAAALETFWSQDQ